MILGNSIHNLFHHTSVSLFDVSIDSDNLGDEIIMYYCKEELNKILSRSSICLIPTHRPPNAEELKILADSQYRIICGTNIICPDILTYNLWKLPDDLSDYKNIIAMGVGMNNYNDVTDESVMFYHHILSPSAMHGLRDEYSTHKMREMGFDNVMNTHCITMWGLNDKHMSMIPMAKPDKVVFTLTAHRKDTTLDKKLIESLKALYTGVYFWPQGEKDLGYFNSLIGGPTSIRVLPRTLKSFTDLLSERDIDYVGTRLHGGIHALNIGVRTFIITVDNRAAEISRDTELPCYDRGYLVENLKNIVTEPYSKRLRMNWDNIELYRKSLKRTLSE